jgi:hypothetical protein
MRRSFWIMLVGPRGQHKNSYKTGCTWKRGDTAWSNGCTSRGCCSLLKLEEARKKFFPKACRESLVL